MTHQTAHPVLEEYALDLLSAADAEAVRGHVLGCATCQAELASLEATTAALVAAMASPEEPPARLRERVLASASALVERSPANGQVQSSRLTLREATRSPVANAGRSAAPVSRADHPGRRFWGNRPAPRREWLVAAVLLLALLGSGGAWFSTAQQSAVQARRDGAALALLTSTETTNTPLQPVSGTGVTPQSHGHWFHRAGVDTQVLVGEFLPSGVQYQVWARDGATQHELGTFITDAGGYGRLIVLGSDGSSITRIEIRLGDQVLLASR